MVVSWWVFALAGAYVGYFGLLASFEVRGERLQWRLDSMSGAVLVESAAAGSPAAVAGLHPGDRIVALHGRPIVDVLDAGVATAHFPRDQPVDVQVEREGRTFDVVLGPPAPTLDGRMILVLAFIRLPSFVIALVFLWRRPRDPQALVGAWLMATLATTTDIPREGMAAAWRALPFPVAALLWIPYVSGFVFATAIGFTFCASFPRPLFHRRRTWVFLWLPALVGLVSISPILARVAADGRTGPGDFEHVLRLAPPVNLLYVLGSLAALVVGYRRLVDANEKRRVRVLVAGSAVALTAVLPVNIVASVAPEVLPRAIPLIRLLSGISTVLAVVFPASFAYAVLRHRVLDLRLVVRASVRYALARRTLLALVPTLAGVLALDLLLHGNEPLVNVIARRGWVYGCLAAFALWTRNHKDRWLDALDRRFFRERYDALRLLRGVVTDVEHGANPAAAGLHAVSAVESAFHPVFVALLLEEAGTGWLLPIAVAPTGLEVPSWPADSQLLQLLQVLGGPLEVPAAEAAGVTAGLPVAEIERLTRTGVDLLVPVRVRGRKAVLLLGPKRSAEPWDREERDVLATVALALARLALEPGHVRDVSREAETEPGTAATPSSTLAGRYRLDRRLGLGGMGIVYEAFDCQLQRLVAVKLLREDRARRGNADKRFRREARALAAFSHPNVVTIHDFGVTAEGRAYFVMEFLSGPTLRRLLERGPLAPSQALTILRGIGDAVEAAHRRQIVHRDLKPENVILARGETGEVPKVLDFGLARLLPIDGVSETESVTGGIAGTPRYMAPEQVAGGPVVPQWDLWAFSVMAYEMLWGTHPFDGDVAGWRAALMTGRCQSLRVPGVDTQVLTDWFARALAPVPADRPASMSSLLSELGDALAPRVSA